MSWKPTCVIVAMVVLSTLPAAVAEAQGTCTISSTGVNFGTYDVFAAAHDDVAGSLTYSCTEKLDVTIHLSMGLHASTFSPRRMSNGGALMDYNLHTSPSHSSATIWGDGTGGSVFYDRKNVPKNQTINVNIHARCPALQDVAAGNYSDTVTATINF